MIINGTTVRAFGYLALSCFQAKYPNPNRNSFWQVAVSWEFFQILRALVISGMAKRAPFSGMKAERAICSSRGFLQCPCMLCATNNPTVPSVLRFACSRVPPIKCYSALIAPPLCFPACLKATVPRMRWSPMTYGVA